MQAELIWGVLLGQGKEWGERKGQKRKKRNTEWHLGMREKEAERQRQRQTGAEKQRARQKKETQKKAESQKREREMGGREDEEE